MLLPELPYIQWAKALPAAEINLARSGVPPRRPKDLGLGARDLVVSLPVTYGYAPLREAIAARYGVRPDQVFTVSGGTTFANWLACATLLGGATRGAEVIVERPTYEPLLAIPRGLGCRVRRLPRRPASGYAIDLDRFVSLVTPRTRLAIVSNLHNPSGARIPMDVLREMARRLARARAVLLVDEVYLECTFEAGARSCVHAGPNVVTTNSLTKAYGLDGLRAGWILGPAALVGRMARAHDVVAGNGVAMGERMALAAFARIDALGRGPRAQVRINLAALRAFLRRDPRVRAMVPEGGTVALLRLRPPLDGDRLAAHLLARHSMLVTPGRFFEAPRAVRLGVGVPPAVFREGLARLSRGLDELAGAV